MEWQTISSSKDIEEIIEHSKTTPCLIFKHSTRCPVSSIAKMRLEKGWDFSKENLHPYYLDLITFRDVSNHVAEVFQVHHESPQVLLIREGNCTYDSSHLGITIDELKECFHDTF